MKRFYIYSLLFLLLVVQVNGGFYSCHSANTSVVRAEANPFWLLLLQESSWNQTFGGVNNDYGYAIVEHSTGGFGIGGVTYDSDSVNGDFWLIRVDEEGDHLWTQSYGISSDQEHCLDIVECSDGGFALAGYCSPVSLSYDALLLRTDASGNHLWNQSYDESDTDIADAIIELSGGGFALAGSSDKGAGSSDGWLLRVDGNGHHLWNRTYGGTEEECFHSVLELSNGFLLTGYTVSSGVGSFDVFLVRTDSNGNQLWNQTYGGLNYDCGYETVLCDDGGFAIGAYTHSFGVGSFDFWLIRTDASGDVQWNQTFGGGGDDTLRSITLCDEGGFALFGRTDSYGAGNDDYWLVRSDHDGNHYWNLTFGGSQGESGWDVAYSSDNDGLALIGHTSSYGDGGTDVWLVWLEDDPPPTTIQIPSFPLASILLGVFCALGLAIVIRRKPRSLR